MRSEFVGETRGHRILILADVSRLTSINTLFPRFEVSTMKSTVSATVITIAICVVAASLGGATADNVASNAEHKNDRAGQIDHPTGRFQISSFATSKSGSGVGYYVIDSTTGEIWMNYGDNKPSKVSDPLLK